MLILQDPETLSGARITADGQPYSQINPEDYPLADGINCRQVPNPPYYPNGLLSPDALQTLANNWRAGGHPHVLECLNDVLTRAIQADVNPILAVLIWFNESGASNYDGFDYPIEDFGIHKTNDDPTVPEPRDFSGQLDFWLGLSSGYKAICGNNSMEIFAARFLGGSCTPTQATQNYLQGLKEKWQWIAPGTSFPDTY